MTNLFLAKSCGAIIVAASLSACVVPVPVPVAETTQVVRTVPQSQPISQPAPRRTTTVAAAPVRRTAPAPVVVRAPTPVVVSAPAPATAIAAYTCPAGQVAVPRGSTPRSAADCVAEASAAAVERRREREANRSRNTGGSGSGGGSDDGGTPVRPDDDDEDDGCSGWGCN